MNKWFHVPGTWEEKLCWWRRGWIGRWGWAFALWGWSRRYHAEEVRPYYTDSSHRHKDLWSQRRGHNPIMVWPVIRNRRDIRRPLHASRPEMMKSWAAMLSWKRERRSGWLKDAPRLSTCPFLCIIQGNSPAPHQAGDVSRLLKSHLDFLPPFREEWHLGDAEITLKDDSSLELPWPLQVQA